MTIAANIASLGSNWSTGVVGTGTLSRGHSDDSPPNRCAADPDDAKAWVESDCTGQTRGTLAFDQRRTQFLSNSEVVWDFGGNVWQWVDYNNPDDKPTPAIAQYYDFTAITGSTTTPKSHLVPLASVQDWWEDSWNSTQGIGRIYPGEPGSGGALFRGAQWNTGAAAGLFAAFLANLPSSSTSGVGLRCAWQP